MMTKRQAIFEAINRERYYQENKWNCLYPHTVGEWLLVLEAELQEAKQGWVKGKGDGEALKEILQVIAVGIACLEDHRIVERE